MPCTGALPPHAAPRGRRYRFSSAERCGAPLIVLELRGAFAPCVSAGGVTAGYHAVLHVFEPHDARVLFSNPDCW